MHELQRLQMGEILLNFAAMSQKPSIPTGTRDFLPGGMLRREMIFDTIRSVFRKYGYSPIETPAMEKLSVLTGKYGELEQTKLCNLKLARTLKLKEKI